MNIARGYENKHFLIAFLPKIFKVDYYIQNLKYMLKSCVVQEEIHIIRRKKIGFTFIWRTI